MKYNYKIFFIYLTIFFICILSSCVPKEQGLIKNQNITEKQEDVKCYVDVKSSNNFDNELVGSISSSLISDFVKKISPIPPEGINLNNSCVYYIHAQTQGDTTIVTITGQGINSYGNSKLEGMDGFQKSLLKSLYRSVENKIKLCQKYGNYLEECFNENINLIETGKRIRLENVLRREKIPQHLIKEKKPLKKGIYVSVGGNKYNYSYDGKNWVNKKFNIKVDKRRPFLVIESITHGNGLFLAVGNVRKNSFNNRGKILVSVNGEEWEDTNFQTRDEFRSVSYAKGIYFVIGNKELLVSEDGYNWINIKHSNLFSPNNRLKIQEMKVLNDKVFGFGRYKIFTMNDDLTWDSHKYPWYKSNRKYIPYPEGIAYGNGKYVLMGWDNSPNYSMRRDYAFMVSEDGEDWDYYNDGGFFSYVGLLLGITYGKGIFVAVGSKGQIFVSEDGINWRIGNFDDEIHLNDVIFVNNTFLAVSSKGINDRMKHRTIVSEDDVNWDYVGCNCGGRAIIFRPR